MILCALMALITGLLYAHFAAKAAYGWGAEIRKAEYEKVQQYAFSNLDHFAVSSLITRKNGSEDAQGRPIVENPELQLTALYFMQQLRKTEDLQMTEELKEIQEEMLAHYVKGTYIVAYQEDQGVAILRQKDGKVLQPLFTDIQEYLKFQNSQKDVKFKTAVIEAENLSKILAKETTGVVVNPYSINLQLQVNRKNEEN